MSSLNSQSALKRPRRSTMNSLICPLLTETSSEPSVFPVMATEAISNLSVLSVTVPPAPPWLASASLLWFLASPAPPWWSIAPPAPPLWSPALSAQRWWSTAPLWGSTVLSAMLWWFIASIMIPACALLVLCGLLFPVSCFVLHCSFSC